MVISDTDLAKPEQSVTDPGPGSAPGSMPHGGLGMGCQGDATEQWEVVVDSPVPMFVFSARTCLERLPTLTPTQIDKEITHLQALDASVHERLTAKSNLDKKRNVLHKSLTDSLIREVDLIVNKYDSLVHSICRSVENSKQQLDGAQQLVDQIKQPVADSTFHLIEPDLETDGKLQDPVSFSDISFSDISYDDVEQSFNFDQKLPGYRCATYFGAVEYAYGNIKHSPAPYPESNPILDQIFTRLQTLDSDFTPENFTCLITKYTDGNASINMHQDNEKCILPGSNIYTVSFGAQRTLRLYNITGPLQEHFHELHHGSVNIMTKESQSVWKHGIDREPTVQGGRISLTFRRIIKPSPTPTSPKQQRTPQSPISAAPKHDRPTRVLLITDSILASTPTHIFETLPKHICIKHFEPQLANIDKYSAEFEYSDVVIISMGVNDLNKYKHTPHSLADCIGPRLKNYSTRYPNTKFIFNSLLLTTDKWLNDQICVFNQIIFEMSRNIRNLSYFDSDRFSEKKFAENQHIKNFYVDGIHVSLPMRKLITNELVASVGYLTGLQGDRYRRCEWLRNVTTRSSWGWT